jgi:hypothetical protein
MTNPFQSNAQPKTIVSKPAPRLQTPPPGERMPQFTPPPAKTEPSLQKQPRSQPKPLTPEEKKRQDEQRKQDEKPQPPQ